jgi:hypothetical protein
MRRIGSTFCGVVQSFALLLSETVALTYYALSSKEALSMDDVSPSALAINFQDHLSLGRCETAFEVIALLRT